MLRTRQPDDSHGPGTERPPGGPGQVYLVTGGCGFLGKHLVRLLVEQENRVSEIRVFDRKVDTEMESLSTDSVTVMVIEGDLSDREHLIRASQGVDVIMHLASLIDVFGTVPEKRMEEVNVQGTRHVIEACVANGISRCVYASSMEVVGPNTRRDPFIRGNEGTVYNTLLEIPYSRTKAAAERAILSANGMKVSGGAKLLTCAVRPTGIYGEECPSLRGAYQRACRCGGRLFRLGPCAVQLGRVYVGNVAWMHILAARGLEERPELMGGQAYYCTDTSPDRSHMDFNMELLAPCGVRLVGQERPLLPYAVVYLLAVLLEFLQLLLRPFGPFASYLNRHTLAMASTNFTVRTEKAGHHFGYHPLYPWQESRERTVRWLLSLRPQGTGHKNIRT